MAPDAPAAAAQPVEPQTMPATDAAVVSNKPGDYRRARAAERIGKPLADVAVGAEAPVEAAPAAPAAAPVSRKERERLEANERTQKAVELATADLRKQIDELRAAPKPVVKAPVAVVAPVEEKKETPVQAAKRYAAMPDAPKFDDYDSLAEHAAAMALFIDDKRTEERTAAARTHSETQQVTTERTSRISAFDERVKALTAADPDIVSKIVPVAQSLGAGQGPNKVISEVVMDSPVGPQLLRHFADHPDALARLTAPIAGADKLTPQTAINRHIQFILRELSKLEETFATAAPVVPAAKPVPVAKVISDAPAPVTVTGSRAAEAADPMDSAIRNNDTRAYRRLRQQERAAQMGR